MPLIKKQYNSEFTSESDRLFGNLSEQIHIIDRGTFSDLYLISNCQELIENAAISISNEIGFDFNKLVEEDKLRKGQFSEITSVVGDDEITTTNSRSYGPVSIVVAPIVSNIKLSRKDVGISHKIGNFAEGWIVLPPHREADFSSVTKRHANNGVPFVLDIVKLKQLSAVRKQSNLDMDFESKYSRLYETTSWVDRLWFTYDYHQMSLIFSSCIFDYKMSKTFPFLYKEEGGCGGLPPYDNIDTAISGLFSFRRGQGKDAIIGIMQESTNVQTGRLKMGETIFLKAVHLAQIGGTAWKNFEKAYRHFLKHYNRLEAGDLIRSFSEMEELAPEIKELGVEIDPDDPLLGVAISHLRKDGLILTELDVRILLEGQEKYKALKGDIPMKFVLEQIEQNKRSQKVNPLVALGRMYNVTELHINDLSPMETDEKYAFCYGIMKRYYEQKTSGLYQTSFLYTDAVRIFKASEIMMKLVEQTNYVRSDIVNNMKISDSLKFNPHIFDLSKRMRDKISWLDSKPLDQLLREPLPDGIGPDDSRIMRSVLKIVTQYKRVNLIVFSSDNNLLQSINIVLSRHDIKYTLTQINIYDYVNLCLSTIDKPDFGQGFYPSPIRFYNFITKNYKNLDPVYTQRISIHCNWRGDERKTFTLVDFPNMERNIESLELSRNSLGQRKLTQEKGGFLKRNTLLDGSVNESWNCMPWTEMSSIFDFHSEKKVIAIGSHEINLPNKRFWSESMH